MNALKETVIAALTEDHIARITGLSKGQLRAWDRRGFFVPKYAYDERGTAYSRIYSFKDAVGLRTLAELRAKHRVSLSRLEKLARAMEKDGISHRADAKIWIVNGEPSYLLPGDDNEVKGAETGQLAMLAIIDVIDEVSSKISDLKKRQEKTVGQVERQKFVARNSWVVAGTRIPTATIQRYADAGFSTEQILAEYPSLTQTDVEAALQHEKALAKSA